jgi:threonine-phosphate decarboxylase
MKPRRHGGDIWGVAKRRSVAVSRLIDFSANINPLGFSLNARKRLVSDIGLVSHYPDQDQAELRTLIASRDNIAPDCILFGNGSTHLIHLIPRFKRYRKVLVVEPTFSEYRAALSNCGTKITDFFLNLEENCHFDLRSFIDSVNRERPDAAFLANPNNPTGALIPKRQIARAVAFCERNGIDLVLDESFIELTLGVSMVERAARLRHLIVVRSLTKCFALPGLRIGYVVANRSVIEGLAASIEPWSVNTLALSAAAACISDANYLQRSLRLIQRERNYLFRGVAKLGWLHPYPSNANFLLVRIRKPHLSSASLKRKLETANILIRDTQDFRGLGAKYVRLAVRRRGENRRLLIELARIEKSVTVRRKSKR